MFAMIKKYKVLMVDDQRWWYDALAPILEELDCSVDFANTAHSAIAAIKIQAYDLIILDLRLTENKEYDVQGLDVLESLAGFEKAPPTIVLSGHITAALKQKTTKLKAYALLDKTGDEKDHARSFDRDAFVQTVKKALGQD
jgi:two-component system nitrogen regulation response regulator NtrX